jgi:hypothetical protein
MAEYAMPAAVILAGVLIVVALGFVISRAMRDDDNAGVALIPGAASPTATRPPVADEPIIPLPSASASARPSPSATDNPPPARKQPADEGTIRIARAGVPDLVDLSAEGRRDWVHWGELSTFSLERDGGGGFAILEGSPTAPRFRHALSPERFQWDGGSPVEHSDGTPTGIRTCGKGNGFTLSVPAATANRTLRLYIGVVAARGRLEGKLSTGGDTRTATIEQRADSLRTASFQVTYRAPRAGKLTLKWVTETAFSSDCGGVALEAATLR